MGLGIFIGWAAQKGLVGHAGGHAGGHIGMLVGEYRMIHDLQDDHLVDPPKSSC